MKNHVLALVALVTLLTTCAHAQTPAPKLSVANLTAAQVTEIEQAIQQAHKEMSEAVNRLSSDAARKYSSVEFQERVGGGNISPAEPGKDAYLKWLSELFANRTNQKFETTSVKVQVVSADVAYSIYVGGGSVTYKKTGRYAGFGNAITFLWRKEAAGWRVIHCHESWW